MENILREIKAIANSNGKIYCYKDGTKKVFVNDQPVEIKSKRVLDLAAKVNFYETDGKIYCALKKEYKTQWKEQKGGIVDDYDDYLFFDVLFDPETEDINKYLAIVEETLNKIEKGRA